ncbi:MAG: glycosyltransferase, partial [Solirubrobacterales bacterium]|nr:glycosyltransferase [Solirubrobacterales bacterium]
MSTPSPRVRTITVDTAGPLPEVDLAAADEWRIHVLHGGVPCAHVHLPNPGTGADPGLLGAAVRSFGESRERKAAFTREFARRLGEAPPAPAAHRTCSVIVCTRRRRAKLGRLLEALARLDPSPDEVIVVDNDPGSEDCRHLVEASGGRYVREDRHGLNTARHTGAGTARGELLAFTDDDCIPPPDWLARLDEHFDDPSVGAVSGPALAWSLDEEPQRRREVMASFVHGLDRRIYDWRTLRPVHAGQVGAGANMIMRRTSLERLDEPFPPELDAGTPTRSGGDLYVLYRLLASGVRVIYDPATFVFHDHRGDSDGPTDTASSYGTGLASFLTRALICDREPATFLIWRWLWLRWVSAGLSAMSRRGDREHLRLRGLYLRGGLKGPLSWHASRRRHGRSNGPIAHVAAAGGAPAATTHAGEPPAQGSLSVVVALDEAPVAGCLEALAAEARQGLDLEIVVAGCSDEPVELPDVGVPVRVPARRGDG